VKLRVSLAALVWVCVCLAPSDSLAAQGFAAAIEGRVLDDTGAPIAAITLTARNEATGFERLATTGEDGRFLLVGLPAEGDYSIRAQGAGFAAVVRDHVSLRPDQVLVLDFTLRVTAADTVAVVATAAPLDGVQATQPQTVDEYLVRALPVSGRGFMPLASLAAGFSGHPDFPNPLGQLYWTNNVLVDGASHFSKWRSAARSFSSGVPLEAVNQVQVLTGLFSAEFGEGLASVTSVTTKAGTNEWHGSALVFARDAALDAAPAFSTGKPPGEGQQYGFSLGGPLALDRTHLFTAYEHRRARDRNIVVSPAAPQAEVPDDQDERLLYVRADHQYRGRLVTARYAGERFAWHHEPGGLTLPATGTRYATNVHTVLVTAGLPVSSGALHDLRFQFSRYVHRRTDLQPGVFVSRAGYSIEGGALGPWGVSAEPEDTWEAADTFARKWGGHALRLGGGFKHVRARSTDLPYGWGAYFFAGPPERVAEPFLFVQTVAPTADAAVVNPRSLSAFTFVQDDWALRAGLRLNLGLRYDVERISNVRGYRASVDTNNLQPRVGMAWDVNGRGRTVVRGGAGLYTQQHLLYPINRVQLEGIDGGIALTLAPRSALFPTFPRTLSLSPGALVPPRDIHRVDPGFRNPFALQTVVGVQQAFAGGVLTADWIRLHGRHLISLVDANAPASAPALVSRSVEQADATRPLVPVPGGFRKIITLGNEGQSWYQALQVRFDRSRGPVHVAAAYTLARAEDMANYELPADSRNLAAEKGRSSADLRQNVVAGLAWDLPGATPLTRGWSLGGIGTFRGHRPYTISWGDDRTGTTQNNARPGERNTGRTGPYRTVDLSLTRRFRRGPTTIDARAQAFNALDAINYDRYVGELLSPLFGRPVSAFPPRRIELAAIVRF
jgi:hypothetical protein